MADFNQLLPSAQQLSFGMDAPQIDEAALVPNTERLRSFGQKMIPSNPRDTLTVTKQAAVEEASATKQALFGSVADQRNLATAIEQGNDLGQEQMAEVLNRGNAGEILALYGPEVLAQAPELWRQQREVDFQEADTRESGEVVTDSLLGAGAGAVSAVGGLVSLGAGIFNEAGGARAAEDTAWLSNSIRDQQSQEIQDQRDQAAVRAALDQQDIARQYEDDVASGESFAGLKRFGREVLSSASDLASNPELAGDVISEGAGSLLVGGGIAKGLSVGAAGMPAIIGGLEAGGSYVEIQARIQAMSPEDLMENSPEYRSLRAEGMTHEDARNSVASDAGLQGAAMAGVVGAVTGPLVAKFEAAPFSSLVQGATGSSLVPALRALGQQTLAEATEEGIQGAAAPLISNIAVQANADETQDLTQGIGQELVTGVVAGAGMVAPLQVPALANAALRDTGAGLSRIGQGVATAAQNQLRRGEAAIDKSSPVGSDAVSNAAEQASQGLEEAVAAIRTAPITAASEPGVTAPAAGASVKERMSAIESSFKMTGPETNALPAGVRAMFLNAEDDLGDNGFVPRLEAIEEIKKELKTADPATALDAVLFLQSEVERFTALNQMSLEGLPAQVVSAMKTSQKALEVFLADPEISKITERSRTITAEDFGTIPEISDATIDSPEVSQAITRMDQVARVNPAGVNVAFINQLLNQRAPKNASGGDTFGLPQFKAMVKRLKAAAAIAVEADLANKAKQITLSETEALIQSTGIKDKPKKSRDIVSQEIMVDGYSEKHNQLSISQHAAKINKAMGMADVAGAQSSLDTLGKFANHMENKLTSANQSAALKSNKNNKVTYKTLTPFGWIGKNHKEANSIYVNPFSPSGVQTWRDIAIDAQAVRNAYNAMLDAYAGELKGAPMAELALPDFTALLKKEPVAGVKEDAKADSRTEEKEDQTSRTSVESADTPVTEQAQTPEPETAADPGAGVSTDVDPGTGSDGNTDAPTQSVGDSAVDAGNTTGDVSETGESIPELGDGTDPGIGAPSFNHLAKDESGLNRFTRAFKVIAGRSKLMETKRPALDVLEKLGAFDKNVASFDLPYRMDGEQAATWESFLVQEGAALLNGMNARLGETISNLNAGGSKGGMTPLEALAIGSAAGTKTEFLRFRRTLVLNLVDPVTGKYDPQLIQAAVLAAMHWSFSAPKARNLDDAEIAKIVGVDETEVDAEMRAAAAAGITPDMAKEALGRLIVEFWGAQVNKNAPLSDIRGISEGLAAELIGVMAKPEVGLLTRGEITINKKTKNGQVLQLPSPFYSFGSEKTLERQRALRSSKSFLADISVTDREVTYSFGAPPKSNPRTKKRDKSSTLGKRMQDALAMHRDIQVFRNRPYTDLMMALGRDNYLELRGLRPINEANMNEIHRKSVEGKNISLNDSWDGIIDHSNRLETFAGTPEKNPEGRAPDEIATHFDAFLASNERVHFEGFNPQGNKDMREAYVATKSVLDMTQEKDQSFFWLSVAQSVGIKTELRNRAANVSAAQTKMAKYDVALGVLKAWLADPSEAIPQASYEQMRDNLGVKPGTDVSAKLLHALLSVAKYELLLEDPEANQEYPTKFEHALSLEADGKTDGPINAMLAWLGGSFNAAEILTMRKGGFFPNESEQTLNGQGDRDRDDLYTTTAAIFSKLLAGRRAGAKGTQGEEHMEALLRVLKVFGDVRFEKINGVESLTVTRNGMKNPLTITIYGSTEKGMAGKVANGMTDAVYELLSEFLEEKSERRNMGEGSEGAFTLGSMPQLRTYPSFKQDLALLTGSRAVSMKKGGKTVGWNVENTTAKGGKAEALGDLENSRKFLFTPIQREMLRENIRDLYVEPMMAAIDQTVGEVRINAQKFQRSTNAQSVLHVARFKKEMKALVLELRAEGKIGAGEWLSEVQFNELSKRLSKFGAVIEGVTTEDHHINLSTKEGGDSGISLSSNLNEEMKGNASMPMPKRAGVSAIPMMTISRGDAQMMVNFFLAPGAQEAGALKTLPVFDGLEMPADLIEQLSLRINEAVAQGWLENPAQDIADSFANWLRQGTEGPVKGVLTEFVDLEEMIYALNEPKSGVLQSFQENVKQALQDLVTSKKLSQVDFEQITSAQAAQYGNKFSTFITPEVSDLLKDFVTKQEPYVEALLGNMSTGLNTLALSIQARKNVYKRIQFSVDHMASGETPYTHQGETWDPNSGVKFIDWINNLYTEELAKLLPKAKSPSLSKDFQSRIQEYGQKVPGSNLVKMPAKVMIAVLDSDLVSDGNRALIKAMKKVMPADFTFMIGKPDELARWRTETFGTELTANNAIEYGQYDPATGIIYVANMTDETLVHEMLHAALVQVVNNYTGDPEGFADPTMKAALGNLETLMYEFMGLDLSREAPEVAGAAQTLLGELNGYLGRGDDIGRAAAILEFISWTLTNQALADTLGKTKIKEATRGLLTKLIDQALAGLRKLLGLAKDLPLDMLSNIKWNTGAVLRMLESNPFDQTQGPAELNLPSITLNQLSPTGSSARMTELALMFEEKIGSHLKAMNQGGITTLKSKTEELEIRSLANNAVNRIAAGGYNLNPAQISLFRSIQAAMASSMRLDNKALIRTQRLFSHVVKQLNVETFMQDPTDSSQRNQAELRFDAVIGKFGSETDAEGRSNLMASFLALTMVSDSFREVVSKFDVPKDRELNWNSADDFLHSLGDSLINSLETKISGAPGGFKGGKSSLTGELDRLAQILGTIEQDDKTLIETKAFEAMENSDGYVSEKVQTAAGWLVDNGREITKTTNTWPKQMLGRTMEVIGGVVSKEHGRSLAESMISLMNQSKKLPQPLIDLFDDIVGVTDENEAIYKLLPQVKTAVSRMRQEYRKILPEYLRKKFSRDLTDGEWTAMYQSFAKADVAALGNKYSAKEIRAIVSRKSDRDAARLEALDVIQKEAGARNLSSQIEQKAEELAQFLATGIIDKTNHNLLRNAEQVSRLLGESGARSMRKKGGPSAALIAAVDRYTSLFALDLLTMGEPEMMTSVSTLIDTESTGVDFLVMTLFSLKADELSKTNDERTQSNGWKGYIPSESKEGATLMVAEDSEYNRLVTLGFTRVGDYNGSGFESGKRGYYYSTVGGKAPWNQGVLQTVQSTIMGVEPMTGRDRSGITGGVIIGQNAADIEKMLQANPNRGRKEVLIPIYDGLSSDRIVGYERALDPEMLTTLGRSSDLAEMMGAWAGRQIEESMAETFNEKLIETVNATWIKGKTEGREGEFINLADEDLNNPVWQEAWKLMPKAAKVHAAKVFGEPGIFMVRRDMINNTVGYRMPSVRDAWTGGTNVAEPVMKVIRDITTLVAGKNAFPYAVRAEKFLQAGISVAKNIIVVKSVLVPVANAHANVVQLMMRGVPVRDIWEGFKTKFVEVSTYQRNDARAVEIRAELAYNRGNTREELKLRAELKALDDANQRMSIWPLIEAGEFTTIAEGEIETNAAISEGKWAEYMQSLMDKIPAQFGTIGRYATVARDTALFQGMSRAVQYGDFLSKAVLYDHITKTQKQSRTEGLRRISREFVAYSYLPGRTRSYVESIGLAWFWSYKLRSIKIARELILENPLRALLLSTGVDMLPDVPLMGTGSVLEDNALNVIWNGKAEHSLGLGMLWNAPGLNPLVNALS